MILCFKLSMPSNNSWNGKWTGSDRFYAKTHNFGRSKKSNDNAASILNIGYFTYDFGDGWVAGITVEQICNKDAIQIRKKSMGFCGYDWMIDSIIQHGKITTKQG